MTAPSFLVCLHDATPAYARETRMIIRELAPLLGRRLSIGVVPDWHGEWPLVAHRDYCRLVRENCDELLLHGYFHRRQPGWGLTALFAGNCDEMNGLDPDETRRTLERGQRVFTDVFGEPARVFLAPAWQLGHVSVGEVETSGLEHVLGFFSLESRTGRSGPLATFTGTAVAGPGPVMSATGSDGCCEPWIVECQRSRFIRGMSSVASGRRFVGSRQSFSMRGSSRAHHRS